MSVAVATCSEPDVDPDSPILLAALANEGVAAELAAWDGDAVDWSRFDLVVIRSTWDYPNRRAQFLAWARSIERLANPYDAIEFSSDKHYLAELERRGVATIPSHFADVGSAPQFFQHGFVVKPCVSVGSLGAARYRPGEEDLARAHVAALHAEGRDALIQPYVESIDTVGERALIFIDGDYSHAITKGAMLNVTELDRTRLYRTERVSSADAEVDALESAQWALQASGFTGLLYARVDLVLFEGAWSVMELELVEPSLFLTFDENAAARLARAVALRLSSW